MNTDHLQIVEQGAAAIAEWVEANANQCFDLRGADLSGADLSGLSEADLSEADLSGARLSGGRLYLAGAYLNGADLSIAQLIVRLPVGDPRGYDCVAHWTRGEWRIIAGYCRYFTLRQARTHWGWRYDDDRAIGDRYIAALNWFEKHYPCPEYPVTCSVQARHMEHEILQVTA